MPNTIYTGMTPVASGQSQKEVTINANAQILDNATGQTSVTLVNVPICANEVAALALSE